MSFFDKYEAAIFDLDGTLIDSMHLWNNICSDWLSSKNIIPGETLEADVWNMTLSQSAEYVRQNYKLNLSCEEIIFQWEDELTSRYLKGSRLKQGVKELLEALSSKNKKLGIATYSFIRSTETILEHYEIYSYFNSFNYAHKQNKKDPGFWLDAAKCLNTLPEKCIVFEDSFSSIEGVKLAGMGVAAVFDPACFDWQELSKASDIALDYPGQALLYLK